MNEGGESIMSESFQTSPKSYLKMMQDMLDRLERLEERDDEYINGILFQSKIYTFEELCPPADQDFLVFDSIKHKWVESDINNIRLKIDTHWTYMPPTPTQRL